MPFGGNSWLVALRVSGTGVAWRPSLNEFCYRDPIVWLSAAMLRRCTGLPVVIEHPAAGVLDADTFRATIVAVTVLAFARGDELWAVARCWDGDIATAITDSNNRLLLADTSPSVIFNVGETTTVALDDGTKLLVEGEPRLVDHIAIVIGKAGEPGGGVWSRGSRKTGVDQTAIKELENA